MKKKGLLFSFLLLVGSMFALSSCGAGVDYVSQTHLETSYSYTSNNFLDNGIGEVTLKNPVDGDTAHFYQVESRAGSSNGRVVKVRFFGLDTPESTGQIEPWGKAASKFTTEKLQEAKTIVLTKDIAEIGTAANHDSTGTRFMALVWIGDVEHCPQDQLKCLNLWVVQEGYSNAKSVTESELGEVFMKADMQAQKKKRGMWAGTDPNFYAGEATVTSIKAIVEAVAEEGDESAFEMAKVCIVGIVAKISGSDAYLVQEYEDDDTGEVTQYGMFVFSGYKHYAPLETIGNELQITGVYQTRYGNPQLTSVSYNKYHPGEDDMQILSTGHNIDFEVKNVTDIVGNDLALNSIVQINNLHGTGGYNEIDQTTEVPSGALTIYARDDLNNEITFRVPADVWAINRNTGIRVKNYEYFCVDGETFNVLGAIEKYESLSGRISYQIVLTNKADLTFNDAN